MKQMALREAIEAAARWLREGRTPPRAEAERIVQALDLAALAMARVTECTSLSKSEKPEA